MLRARCLRGRSGAEERSWRSKAWGKVGAQEGRRRSPQPSYTERANPVPGTGRPELVHCEGPADRRQTKRTGMKAVDLAKDEGGQRPGSALSGRAGGRLGRSRSARQRCRKQPEAARLPGRLSDELGQRREGRASAPRARIDAGREGELEPISGLRDGQKTSQQRPVKGTPAAGRRRENKPARQTMRPSSSAAALHIATLIDSCAEVDA